MAASRGKRNCMVETMVNSGSWKLWPRFPIDNRIFFSAIRARPVFCVCAYGGHFRPKDHSSYSFVVSMKYGKTAPTTPNLWIIWRSITLAMTGNKVFRWSREKVLHRWAPKKTLAARRWSKFLQLVQLLQLFGILNQSEKFCGLCCHKCFFCCFLRVFENDGAEDRAGRGRFVTC